MSDIRRSLFSMSQGWTRQTKQLLIWSFDALMAPICFLWACVFTYSSFWPAAELHRLLPVFLILAFMGGLASLSFGLLRIKLKSYQTFVTTGIMPYAGVVGMGVFVLTQLPGLHFPMVGTLSFTLILFLGAIGGRVILLRLYLWALRHNKVQVRVLIYGAGETGLQLASALKAHETIRVVGFIDDDLNKTRERMAGLRIMDPARIEEIVRNYEVSRVILALPSTSAPKQARIGRRLQALGLEVQVVPSFAQLGGTETLINTLKSLQPGHFLGRARLDHSLPDGGDFYRGRVVMVTGAGGSVGSELCRQILASSPAALVLFELSELALYNIVQEMRELRGALPIRIVPVLGSVADGRAVRQALEENRVEIVLHAAAYKHVPLVEENPIAGLMNNAMGTRILADACLRTGVARFLLVSTDKAVRPTNVMGASKRMAELVVQDMAARGGVTGFSIVRFGNVLGSSGSVIPLFKEQIARGGPVTLTHEDVTRFFMTISEAARLVLLAGSFTDETRHGRADVLVLDMGKPVRIRDLAEQLIQAAGYTLRDEKNPAGDIEIHVVGLRPGEKLHEELLIGEGMRETPHPKIMRAAEAAKDRHQIAAALQQLTRLAALGDNEAVRQLALEVALEREPLPRRAVAVKLS